ncbi:hypothetical protein CEXT_205281 [Caerostris extrusa]|uniref:Uncharacterized protein n=1 Tax=Caerostris extrusa TaxID=172846 RepID=A0AAV4RX63_CAEEX|nr:hypothetical protein CEXT_205281 [Caerostris extrusa]
MPNPVYFGNDEINLLVQKKGKKEGADTFPLARCFLMNAANGEQKNCAGLMKFRSTAMPMSHDVDLLQFSLQCTRHQVLQVLRQVVVPTSIAKRGKKIKKCSCFQPMFKNH